jgi:hypothetical protein
MEMAQNQELTVPFTLLYLRCGQWATLVWGGTVLEAGHKLNAKQIKNHHFGSQRNPLIAQELLRRGKYLVGATVVLVRW